MNVNRTHFWLVLAWLLLVFTGCGKSNVSVHGIVTLGNSPVENAMVTFVPRDEQGETAIAWTDESGRYTIYPTDSISGVVPGKYQVRITTYQDPEDDEDNPVPAVPERIPDEYNLRSKLLVEVTNETRELNFPLNATGKVTQPNIGKEIE